MPAIKKVLSETLNLGDLLKYEAPNLYSRERVTVAAGQVLVLGTVVGMIASSGKIRELDPSATAGSQFVAGVLIQDCDAHLIDRDDGLIVARHAIVADHVLRFSDETAGVEKQAALQQLKNLGILVRQGV